MQHSFVGLDYVENINLILQPIPGQEDNDQVTGNEQFVPPENGDGNTVSTGTGIDHNMILYSIYIIFYIKATQFNIFMICKKYKFTSS